MLTAGLSLLSTTRVPYLEIMSAFRWAVKATDREAYLIKIASTLLD